jgi:integrase
MTKHYSRIWRHKGAIIRRRSNRYQAEINRHGQRHRHTEESLAAAKTYVEQKLIELENLGLGAYELTPSQRVDAAAALDRLDGATTLLNAIEFWITHNETRTSSKGLAVLFGEYLAARQRGNLRPASLKEIRNRVGNFVKPYAERQPHTLTPKEIKCWLDKNTPSIVGWKKHRTLIKVFFDFLVAEHYLESNPVAGLRPSVEDAEIKEVQRYTAEEAERLMEATAEVAPRAVPSMAIGLFAGLRPAETDRLDWSNVNFRTKRIKVTGETAKRRRARSVTMENSLIAWLLPYAEKSGAVGSSDSHFRSVRPRILEAAGIKKWLHDGLRHTFGSMHCEKYQDPGKTAHQMGHASTKVMYTHYISVVDDPAEADRFWNIAPADQPDVIQFPVSSAG